MQGRHEEKVELREKKIMEGKEKARKKRRKGREGEWKIGWKIR